MQVQFAVVFREDPEGGYVVSVPDLPEVVKLALPAQRRPAPAVAFDLEQEGAALGA